jgi:hypothetical protein
MPHGMLAAYDALVPHRPGNLLAGLFHPRFVYQLDNRYRQQMRDGVGLGWAFPPSSECEFSGALSAEVQARLHVMAVVTVEAEVSAVQAQVHYFHPLRMKEAFLAEFVLVFDSSQGDRALNNSISYSTN